MKPEYYIQRLAWRVIIRRKKYRPFANGWRSSWRVWELDTLGLDGIE